MKSLRSAFATFQSQGVNILGVSMDTVEDQKKFADKYRLPFSLLADTEGRVCDAFLVGRPKNRPLRETFLFRNGRLVDHDRKVRPVRQARNILKKIGADLAGSAQD